MLGVQVKDVSYCMRGGHFVPREQMTTAKSEDGKKTYRCCEACRDLAIERRKNNAHRKQAKPA